MVDAVNTNISAKISRNGTIQTGRSATDVKVFRWGIEPDGKVGFTKLLKSHPVFERPVLEAIRSWRFAPHTINGRPVGTYTVYKFVFQID